MDFSKVLPKGVTVFGVVLAVSTVFFDPAVIPFISTLVGDCAAEKLAALGALIASLGRAVQEKTKIETEETE